VSTYIPSTLAVVVLVAIVVSDTMAESVEIGLSHSAETALLTVGSLFGMLIAVWTVQLAHGWWRKRGEAT